MHTGSYQQAFDTLGRALTTDPKHPVAFHRVWDCSQGAILAAGSMMQQAGDFDVALTKYRSAARDTPHSAPLWNNIGMCFYGKGKLVAAISCLKRAHYLNSLSWQINYNLGLAHAAMGQHATAFHYTSAAINLQPSVAQLYATLADTLTQLSDHTNALAAYTRALQLDPADPLIPLNLSIALAKQHRLADAVVALQQYDARRQQHAARVTQATADTAAKLHEALDRLNVGEPQGAVVGPTQEADRDSLKTLSSRHPTLDGAEAADHNQAENATLALGVEPNV